MNTLHLLELPVMVVLQNTSSSEFGVLSLGILPFYRFGCFSILTMSRDTSSCRHAKSPSRLPADSSNFSKCYKIKNLTDEEATLLEPASCAIHGMDKLKMPFGAKVLLIGAGPTGLILAQLIKVCVPVSSSTKT